MSQETRALVATTCREVRLAMLRGPEIEHVIEPLSTLAGERVWFIEGSARRATWSVVVPVTSNVQVALNCRRVPHPERARALTACIPALGDQLAVRELLNGLARSELPIHGIFDAIPGPAMLVDSTGVVALAREMDASTCPPFLGGPPTTRLLQDLAKHGRVAPMRIAGRQMAVLRSASQAPAKVRGASLEETLGDALPPSLVGVAKLLVEGRSDKEISAVLGLTVASARTYVARIYARLGVRRRADLQALFLAAPMRPSSATKP